MGAVTWMSRLLLGAVLAAGVVHADLAPAQAASAKSSAKASASKEKKSAKSSASAKVSKVGSSKSSATKANAASAKAKARKDSKSARATSVPVRRAAQNRSAGAVKTVSTDRKSRQAAVASKSARQAGTAKVIGHPRSAKELAASKQKSTIATQQRSGTTQAKARPARSSASLAAASARPAKRAQPAVSARKVSVTASERVSPAAAAVSSGAALASMPAVASGSLGETIGLNRIPDPLALRSSVALVVDPRSGRILYDKNSSAVLPIASVTKLMTAMVVLDAGQPLDEKIRIEPIDRDVERFSSSHLPVGSELTRAELLQLALMSSENRAAAALARTYPGGHGAFVDAANRKAREIGMWDSVFMDGTGLSAANVSTARDLAVLVARASRYPEIARYSVAPELNVRTAYGVRTFRTTNPMVGNRQWGLTLQKTGFINEAGNCLVMQARVDGRQLIIVLLDSQGRYARVSDAQRLRRFIEG